MGLFYQIRCRCLTQLRKTPESVDFFVSLFEQLFQLGVSPIDQVSQLNVLLRKVPAIFFFLFGQGCEFSLQGLLVLLNRVCQLFVTAAVRAHHCCQLWHFKVVSGVASICRQLFSQSDFLIKTSYLGLLELSEFSFNLFEFALVVINHFFGLCNRLIRLLAHQTGASRDFRTFRGRDAVSHQNLYRQEPVVIFFFLALLLFILKPFHLLGMSQVFVVSL